MLSEDRLYWIWLADRCGVASKEFARLIARFDNPFEIFRLEPDEIDTIDYISKALKDRLSQKSLERAYSILKYCKDNRIDIITYADKKYPSRLKTLEDPPALLYCVGKLPDFNSRLCIGVVGTRKISAYGMQSAYKISYELACAGACVVSGMALGVDAVAACAALEAGGCTVAVLGCGIDIVYPKQHTRLKRDICKHGCVLSEYPPAEAPYGSNFPKRNRIISGLCQGLLIVEGNQRSGAMITARTAIAQGREVFALPGKIDESNSEGPNDLIQKGVYVALSSEDIIYHYDFLYHDAINYRGLHLGKPRSEFCADALIKRGVSTDVYFGKAEAVTANVTEKQAEPKACEESIPKKKWEDPYKDEERREKAEGENRGSDNSVAVLESLDAVTRRVLEAMPIDKAISPDEFMSAGISITDAVTSLTVLEIMGLVTSLPGGTYLRK